MVKAVKMFCFAVKRLLIKYRFYMKKIQFDKKYTHIDIKSYGCILFEDIFCLI